MRAGKETISNIEYLLSTYEKEVKKAYDEGRLKESTMRTYLLHANNFVKWCKGNFEPGGRNK